MGGDDETSSLDYKDKNGAVKLNGKSFFEVQMMMTTEWKKYTAQKYLFPTFRCWSLKCSLSSKYRALFFLFWNHDFQFSTNSLQVIGILYYTHTYAISPRAWRILSTDLARIKLHFLSIHGQAIWDSYSYVRICTCT